MHTERRNSATRPGYINYRLKSEYPLHFVVGYVQPVTQQYKSRTVRKASTMKSTDDFCYEGKPSRATAKSTLFAVSKDEYDTKEDTGKCMKNSLYMPWYAKRHL